MVAPLAEDMLAATRARGLEHEALMDGARQGCWKLLAAIHERGLLLLGCGETSIRLCPPLIVKQQEADVALDILEECVALAARG